MLCKGPWRQPFQTSENASEIIGIRVTAQQGNLGDGKTPLAEIMPGELNPFCIDVFLHRLS